MWVQRNSSVDKRTVHVDQRRRAPTLVCRNNNNNIWDNVREFHLSYRASRQKTPGSKFQSLLSMVKPLFSWRFWTQIPKDVFLSLSPNECSGHTFYLPIIPLDVFWPLIFLYHWITKAVIFSVAARYCRGQKVNIFLFKPQPHPEVLYYNRAVALHHDIYPFLFYFILFISWHLCFWQGDGTFYLSLVVVKWRSLPIRQWHCSYHK